MENIPPVHQTKFPASAMMLDIVTSDGKAMLPFWFKKSIKIDQKEYLKVLETVVKQ